jgi:hypothetical protein
MKDREMRNSAIGNLYDVNRSIHVIKKNEDQFRGVR